MIRQKEMKNKLEDKNSLKTYDKTHSNETIIIKIVGLT